MATILDPELETFVSESESFSGPETNDFSVIREGYNRMTRYFQAPHPEGLQIENGAIEGLEGDIPVRVYRPAALASPCPTLLYFHGGGWVVGNLDSHDSITAELAKEANIQVIAVDYRLAPEHLFPAACDDSWTVLQSLLHAPELFSIDAKRLLVGGDSAGANLAAAITLLLRTQNAANKSSDSTAYLKGQLLIYPALSSENLESRKTQAKAPLFTTEEMDIYLQYYLGRAVTEEDKKDLRLFPAQAQDFSNLPPAFLTAAELDPLADDVPDYANKLVSAGTKADYLVEPGLMHGWLRARHSSPRAAAAFARIVEALKKLAET
ncbi:alpha/beta hydrolase [Kiloniella laminariae]|uniref:Alpha/beta hydrolase n=1 Tax=Kiloniella laminariae TaxID=454162 RepID=A0ABT4LK77_9PROT|nr:alpha/beta hydrolase [Kiloniella laminariae]MCZ4281513.1 alpha/beta hydrolase [Kiloniella laminariae]